MQVLLALTHRPASAAPRVQAADPAPQDPPCPDRWEPSRSPDTEILRRLNGQMGRYGFYDVD
ncbi:hypothetical protein [uncultured Deinococcus sp.]|uniref:hypothetical protein n=1 Tax=uncultured Deinococcus sp. TaxID=158789 RepID=UPI0025CE0A4D|nr:hypothetical protein [uncultured Deinococcus sp.]